MYKKILSLTALLLVSGSLSAQLSLSVGSTAPDWTVTDVHGHSHNLYSITAAGQPVIIDFFFTTCGPCQVTAPIITEFYQKYGCNNGDIYVISIDTGDSDAEVLAYEATYPGPNSNPSVSGIEGGGNAVNSAYGPSAYPTVCLIGTDNKLKNIDIWPINSIVDIENAVSAAGINLTAMSCALEVEEMGVASVDLYPNPAEDVINIKLSSNISKGDYIAVYDLSGKEVLRKTMDSNEAQSLIQLDLHELQSGSYHLSIDNNGQKLTKSLVLH